jgi:hypothetical protein
LTTYVSKNGVLKLEYLSLEFIQCTKRVFIGLWTARDRVVVIVVGNLRERKRAIMGKSFRRTKEKNKLENKSLEF